MTSDRIKYLLNLYPKPGMYVMQSKVPENLFGITQLDHLDRMGVCLYDPAFGFNFIRAFVDANKPLPDVVTDEALFRLFSVVIEQEPDEPIFEALALEKMPAWKYQRNLVRAGLIDPKLPLEQLGEFVSLSEEVIWLYDQLFFNVRDRLSEPSYLSYLAYPNGIQVELEEDYSLRTPLSDLMLRASYRYGFSKAAALAGAIQQDELIDHLALAEYTKTLMLKNGVLNGQLYGLNSREMSNVMRLLVAQSVGGKDASEKPSAPQGLAALSMGQGIMEVVKDLQAPDVVERRKLQLAYAVVEKDRKRAELAEVTPEKFDVAKSN